MFTNILLATSQSRHLSGKNRERDRERYIREKKRKNTENCETVWIFLASRFHYWLRFLLRLLSLSSGRIFLSASTNLLCKAKEPWKRVGENKRVNGCFEAEQRAFLVHFRVALPPSLCHSLFLLFYPPFNVSMQSVHLH